MWARRQCGTRVLVCFRTTFGTTLVYRTSRSVRDVRIGAILNARSRVWLVRANVSVFVLLCRASTTSEPTRTTRRKATSLSEAIGYGSEQVCAYELERSVGRVYIRRVGRQRRIIQSARQRQREREKGLDTRHRTTKQ